MNVVDLAIIGVAAFPGMIGLRSGLRRLISGIGGLIIGVILAMQHNAEVALMLAGYIEGELPRRVAAFGGIVIASATVARLIAWMVNKVLNTPVLGWVDHVAGAAGGGALGVVLTQAQAHSYSQGQALIRQGTLSRHPSSLPKCPARRS